MFNNWALLFNSQLKNLSFIYKKFSLFISVRYELSCSFFSCDCLYNWLWSNIEILSIQLFISFLEVVSQNKI